MRAFVLAMGLGWARLVMAQEGAPAAAAPMETPPPVIAPAPERPIRISASAELGSLAVLAHHHLLVDQQ